MKLKLEEGKFVVFQPGAQGEAERTSSSSTT